MATALGEMRMSPETFWMMRPCDFGIAYRGYLESQMRYDIRNWKYFRELMALLYNINRGKGKALRGRDIIRLPTDPQPRIAKVSDEDEEAFRQRIADALSKLPEGTIKVVE